MEQSEIIEGSVLISTFMGAEYERKKDAFEERYHETMTFVGTPGNWRGRNDLTRHQYLTMHLMYHTDWDWIMPVVEKIEEIEKRRFGVEITPFGIVIDDYKELSNISIVEVQKEEGDTKILLLWIAIVDFLKWYNSQSLPTLPLK